MLRSFAWLALVVAVGFGVHFALQGIIQSGDAELRKGPDVAKVAKLEAADPVHGAKVLCRHEQVRIHLSPVPPPHRSWRQVHGPPIAGKTAKYVKSMLTLYRSGTMWVHDQV